MMRRLLACALFAVLASLSACGGGGGNSGDCPLCDGGGGSTVTDLSLTLSAQSVSDSGSDTITATVTAVDANRTVVAAAPVTIAVDANAVVAVSGTTTGTDGIVTGTVGIGSDRSNREITVTAKSGSIVRTATIQVTGSKLTASLVSTVLVSSKANKVTYHLTDVNASPMGGQAISVSAPGLVTGSGTTSASGDFVFTYDAPAAAGALVITATTAGLTDAQTVQVQATAGNVPNAVGPVSSASISANPKTVSTNAVGSSINKSQLRVLFVRAGSAPVPNVRVRFDLNGDAYHVGGTLSSGNSQLYSAADGTVTAAYIPGALSSPTDKLTVRACWSLTDFAAGTCPNQELVNLTVKAEAISVGVRTNELILESSDKLDYIKQFEVTVVDAAGFPVQNATISASLDLTGYGKGKYDKAGTVWKQSHSAYCTNEDANRNGILDTLPIVEDINGSGRIEPVKADATLSFLSSDKTDAKGKMLLELQYPKSVGSWIDFLITVSATGVSGTEGTGTNAGTLPVAATAITTITSDPAFKFSPYGTGACTDPD